MAVRSTCIIFALALIFLAIISESLSLFKFNWFIGARKEGLCCGQKSLIMIITEYAMLVLVSVQISTAIYGISIMRINESNHKISFLFFSCIAICTTINMFVLVYFGLSYEDIPDPSDLIAPDYKVQLSTGYLSVIISALSNLLALVFSAHFFRYSREIEDTNPLHVATTSTDPIWPTVVFTSTRMHNIY